MNAIKPARQLHCNCINPRSLQGCETSTYGDPGQDTEDNCYDDNFQQREAPLGPQNQLKQGSTAHYGHQLAKSGIK